MGKHDHRIYRSYEEFERDELRRLEGMGTTVDEMLDEMFGGELDFDEETVRRSASEDTDDEE